MPVERRPSNGWPNCGRIDRQPRPAVKPTWLVQEAQAHAAAEEEEDDRERLRRRHVEAREVPDLVKRWSNGGQTFLPNNNSGERLRGGGGSGKRWVKQWSNGGQTVVKRSGAGGRARAKPGQRRALPPPE